MPYRCEFRFAVLLAACVLIPQTGFADHVTITHGPLLGRPSAHGMSVWARTSRPAKIQVRYGLSPDKLDKVSSSVQTTLLHDLTGVVNLQDLQSETEYFYRIEIVEGLTAFGGSFRTLPDVELRMDPKYNPNGLFNFQFEFACGNNQKSLGGLGPTMPAYDTLVRDHMKKVDFAILNGDWLYEESRDYSPTAWAGQVGIDVADLPPLVKAAPNIVGVWENYKVCMARPANLQRWHRHVPTYYTFDDHELINDIYGSGTAGYHDRRAVFRDQPIRAWNDYLGWANPTAHNQPVHFGRANLKAGSDILTDSSADFAAIDFKQAANLHVHWGTPDAGVQDIEAGDKEGGDLNSMPYDIVEVIDKHRLRISPAAKATRESGYSIGRRSYGTFKVSNCRFFLLDTRTHRELHDLKRPDKKGLTMLGLEQRNWLLDWMKKDDAEFYFVVSSVNFMVPHVGGGGHAFDAALKDDAWTVFLDERETLINFWDDLNKPVFVLTGDLHNSFAIKVTDNVWEFASGPHNSVNHRAVDEGGRPVNGPFKYGPRACEIRWSSTAMEDIPRPARMFPHFCIVQINNVFNNPIELGGTRWIAYPKPHVIFRYYDGLTGDFKYAETIHAVRN